MKKFKLQCIARLCATYKLTIYPNISNNVFIFTSLFNIFLTQFFLRPGLVFVVGLWRNHIHYTIYFSKRITQKVYNAVFKTPSGSHIFRIENRCWTRPWMGRTFSTWYFLYQSRLAFPKGNHSFKKIYLKILICRSLEARRRQQYDDG
jgi:hypothetical protein